MYTVGYIRSKIQITEKDELLFSFFFPELNDSLDGKDE